MKKILLFLVILFIMTGCKPFKKIAKEGFEKNIENNCANYETVISSYYGGGEGSNRGYAEIGYCDYKLVQINSRVDSIILNTSVFNKREYTSLKEDTFKKIFKKDIFGKNLIDLDLVESFDETFSCFVDLVVSKTDLDNIVHKIQYEFIPIIFAGIQPGYIDIKIYITDETYLNSDNIKISYIMHENPYFYTNDLDDKEKDYYNVLEIGGTVEGNTLDEITDSLNKFKQKIDYSN